MPHNVEVKARVANLACVRTAALLAGAREAGAEDQVDRYYTVDAAGGERVKLRTTSGGRAELVTYRRSEAAGVRLSEYQIAAAKGDGACQVPPGEPIVTVRKHRILLLLDNVRIHLDTVDGLGCFMELEAVLDTAHDEVECRRQVDWLLGALGIEPSTLVRASYSDLLLAASCFDTTGANG